MSDTDASNRDRLGLRLTSSKRDRRIATWIQWQIDEGRDVSEMIKNFLDEIITGKSCLTGQPLVYQGEVAPILPSSEDDPAARALLDFSD